MTQLSRIQQFATENLDSSLPVEDQSLVLEINSGMGNIETGNDNKGNCGTCDNSTTLACNGTNGRCTNRGVCGTSTNTISCLNVDKPILQNPTC